MSDDVPTPHERLLALVVEQAALIAELRDANARLAEEVAELRRRLGRSPRNSDRPPSSEGLAKPPPRSRREPSGRDPGGQPGHEGATLRQVETPDERMVHAPATCAGCAASLADAPVVSVEARQSFDLPPIRLRVTEHLVEHRRCGCGTVTMGQAPAGLGAPAQYGPGVRALAVYVMAGQHLPLARTAELLADVLGAPVSEGSLAAWYADAANRLDGFDEALRDALAAAPVLGADETGARVDGTTMWVHAARTETLTRYTVSDRRGEEGMRQAGVLPALGPTTVLVHDFWAPYWTFDVVHAVCGAHLRRELAAAAETDGQDQWTTRLDGLLCEINNTVRAGRQMGADMLGPDLLAAYQERYDTIIEAGWTANPGHTPGKARQARPKHVNLLDRLDTHREEVLRYAADFRVPFTNNGSEQDVRPVKIRLKIAGSLRTLAGAQAFCRLRSYLSTARKQGQSALHVLRDLHAGNPWMPATAGIT